MTTAIAQTPGALSFATTAGPTRPAATALLARSGVHVVLCSTSGRGAGPIDVALLLVVVLGLRTRARRRYATSSARSTPGSPDRE